ncbi:MAG: bifunctional 4-hydroxy-2-oxoglutarate aldolase/2-dehydro-3-deoxy-phosphogluconate aldolase [Akkermansiaceae bacterium]|nr:bifunctional 4-hydroxy-2-oxoglutarate aldolase/2-dehydro-3-deoxy-phosphogluconate aldolase [Akkermansiaceae bacterium]
MSILLQSPLAEKIRASKLIAVLVIDRAEDGVAVAESLLAGGIDIMELTLRTDGALDALRSIRERVPAMTAGIGTILTREQIDRVIEADAAFGVSPSVNPAILEYAREKGLPFGPGVMTPTDIDTAIGRGCHLLKFFPAESSGGLAHLKNIAAPFLHLGVQFIPLGGVNLANLMTYLDSPLIAAAGGSWIAPRELIAARDWKAIEKNAGTARQRIIDAAGG